MDLPGLASLLEKVLLEKVMNVSLNSFLLRLKLDKYEMTLFPDGGSIILGTNDVSIAKGLYAKYIGM